MKSQGIGQEEALQERMNKVQTMKRPKDEVKRDQNAVAEGKAMTSHTGAQMRAPRHKDVLKKRTPHHPRTHGGQKQVLHNQQQDCWRVAKVKT